MGVRQPSEYALIQDQPKLSPGVVVYSGNGEGSRLYNVLRLAGVATGKWGFLPAEINLPTNQNCIIIGENDAAFRGGNGQAGEGIDEHGRPIPMPR